MGIDPYQSPKTSQLDQVIPSFMMFDNNTEQQQPIKSKQIS